MDILQPISCLIWSFGTGAMCCTVIVSFVALARTCSVFSFQMAFHWIYLVNWNHSFVTKKNEIKEEYWRFLSKLVLRVKYEILVRNNNVNCLLFGSFYIIKTKSLEWKIITSFNVMKTLSIPEIQILLNAERKWIHTNKQNISLIVVFSL